MHVWLYAALVLVSLVSGTAGVTCADHSNGCSVPGGFNFFYKDIFTPSCDRHDVCYGCGVLHGITRDQCDQALLADMKSACAANGHRRGLGSRKRSLCTTTATTMYYEATHIFGASHYNNDGAHYCGEAFVPSCLPSA